MDLHVRGQCEFNSCGIYDFLYREGSHMGFSEERDVPCRKPYRLTRLIERGQFSVFVSCLLIGLLGVF